MKILTITLLFLLSIIGIVFMSTMVGLPSPLAGVLSGYGLGVMTMIGVGLVWRYEE